MLKKELLKILAFGILISLILALINWPLALEDLFFTFGIVLGLLLYDLDHLIYVMYFAPHELTSQRIQRFFETKNYQQGLDLAETTKDERTKLIFHSLLFQIALVIVSLFVLTSSLSLVGKGLVLGLMFHSLVDYLKDISQEKGINWYWQTSFRPTKETQIFVWAVLVIFFIISSLFFV